MNRPTGMVLLAILALAAQVRAQNVVTTLTGRVVWGGNRIPVMANLNLGANPAAAAACQVQGFLKEETWLVDPKNKGLRHVFVWVEPPKGVKLPVNPGARVAAPFVEMDQPFCQFVPHAVALRQGQVLVAKNSSAIAHHLKWQGHPVVNPGGNILIPPGGQVPIPGLLADRLPLSIECNLHPWMRGWVRVFDHPYYDVTDENGGFVIKDPPLGNFRVRIWHGSGGWLGGAKGKDGMPIVIRPGLNDLKDLAYPPP